MTALVAVAAVGLGLSLYAVVFAGVAPTADRDVAEPTLSRVHGAVAPAGVVEPGRLESALDTGPTGWTLYIELRTGSRQWRSGEAPISDADTQTSGRRVAVRTASGHVRSGWLRVVVHR